MLRFLSDENFNGDIVRGLFLRQPGLDLLRVQDVSLRKEEDLVILDWATRNGRILLTHDRATMPDFVYQRLSQGYSISGLFVVPDRMAVRQVIDELLLISTCSEPVEWLNTVLYLPL